MAESRVQLTYMGATKPKKTAWFMKTTLLYKWEAKCRSIAALILKFSLLCASNIRRMKPMKIIAMAAAMLSLLATISVARGYIIICNVNKDDLMPCMPAVTHFSVRPPAQPVQACCSVLRTANLTCFCELENKYPWLLYMFGIDPALAKALPGECKLNSFTRC